MDFKINSLIVQSSKLTSHSANIKINRITALIQVIYIILFILKLILAFCFLKVNLFWLQILKITQFFCKRQNWLFIMSSTEINP